MIPLVSKHDFEGSQPFKPFTDPKTGGVHTIPFPAGPPPWLEYTQDVFDEVLWRWQYNREIDDSPHNLWPHCRECINPMKIADQTKRVRIAGTKEYRQVALVRCGYHPRVYEVAVDQHGDFADIIKRRILERIKDGTYDDVITRQRMHRGW